jgi:hypothetical protein
MTNEPEVHFAGSLVESRTTITQSRYLSLRAMKLYEIFHQIFQILKPFLTKFSLPKLIHAQLPQKLS